MALIGHDLPCRACEIAGQRRAPVVHGWSGGRDEQFTASLDTLVGGLQAVQRGGGAPAARCRAPGAAGGIRVWSAWRTAS